MKTKCSLTDVPYVAIYTLISWVLDVNTESNSCWFLSFFTSILSSL